MKRLMPILLWSAISAAFIGPGTVTTASAAGAGYGFSLLWTLVFSTIACLTLQEASGRLTVVTGLSLGRAMRRHFGVGIPLGVVGAVVIGCVAYEAGNILGAVAGAGLGLDIPRPLLTLATGLSAGVLLWLGSPSQVARVLGMVVALMGLAFLICAVDMGPDMGSVLKGCLAPQMPSGSGPLLLGLIGTTVVPYNLFLGSGLARGQSLRDIRIGLGVAVPFGGIISMGILIVGTAVDGEFSYGALADSLADRLGPAALVLFSFGLFAAGLSSAVTAPLAAALSVRSLMKGGAKKWTDRSGRFRAISLGVLGCGLAFGLTDIKPIPVIILAQALNGIILPLVAAFLFIATNDRKLMGEENLNRPLANTLIGLACLVALLLGISALMRAAFAAVGANPPGHMIVIASATVLATALAIPVVGQIRKRRSSPDF